MTGLRCLIGRHRWLYRSIPGPVFCFEMSCGCGKRKTYLDDYGWLP